MVRFQYASMRRFALGALLYTPGRFGKMRIGDFLDAMTGHAELENERVKSLTDIIRLSTTILWNVHQTDVKDTKNPQELWKVPWDNQQQEEEGDLITDLQRKKTEDDLLEILKRQSDNGNSNQ